MQTFHKKGTVKVIATVHQKSATLFMAVMAAHEGNFVNGTAGSIPYRPTSERMFTFANGNSAATPKRAAGTIQR